MTSKKHYTEAFVWTWLEGETQPIVAGKLTLEGAHLVFNYGKSYLARQDAISIYDQELPLRSGIFPLTSGLNMPGCLRDAAPDAWGRRVIINKMLGVKGSTTDTAQLDELTYLLESGSDRIGALDFQSSATDYIDRSSEKVTLDELLESAERVEHGIPLNPELDHALQHGSSIGGARPKALIEDGNKKYVAKFSLGTDLHNVVKSEFIAMRLAKHVGLNVAPVRLTRSLNKDVLLIERFDRIRVSDGWTRKHMISALTLFGLDEMMARYASYEDLAEIIRHRFTNAPATLRELFGRLVFNILCGNNDDHARNHAAYWDGSILTLTPAYDICPQGRTGNETSQAMLISGNNRMSHLSTCLETAHNFLLSREESIEIFESQIGTIRENWVSVCEEANLNDTDRKFLWRRQFLNPFAFETLEDVFQIEDL